MKKIIVAQSVALLLGLGAVCYLLVERDRLRAEVLRLENQSREQSELLDAARKAVSYYEQTAKDLEVQLKEFRGREDALIQNTESRLRLAESHVKALQAEVRAATAYSASPTKTKK